LPKIALVDRLNERLASVTEQKSNTQRTKNLAIANKSRVSSADEVTTVNFKEAGELTGQEAHGTPVVAAACLFFSTAIQI